MTQSELNTLAGLISARMTTQGSGVPTAQRPAILDDIDATPDQKAKALETYLNRVLDTPSAQWDGVQKDAVRTEVQNVLKGLGY